MKIKCLISGKTWNVKKEDKVSVTDDWYNIKFENRDALMFHKDNKTMVVEK